VNHILTPSKPQTKVQELNIDLFIYAAKCMAQGDTIALQRAGLSFRDIPQLRQLSLSQLIAMSEQGAELAAYLKRARGDSQRSELAQALMEQGAPRELMMALFRMSTRRYSAERMRLGVAGPRGRPMTAHMDAATEQAIWRLWVTLGNELDPRYLRNAEDWLLIAREVPGRLRSAWSLIQRWAQDQDAIGAFRGDRVRLTMPRLARSEAELRHKHGLECGQNGSVPEAEPVDGRITARAA
jgi:NAD-dependent DNA ligase